MTAAADFNHLAATSDGHVVLLEPGAIPATGALDRLVEALMADPRNGIAGPSTNQAWNEQGCFPGAAASDVEATGALAARQFGREVRTLEPLHSLGDFCYAVRREVIEAIGGADEGFGEGPCWEMEYNIRAARAGFRGLWVCGAYVYRAPVSPARRARESQLFDASRRRYQDAVCGLWLRGARSDYESHCRGDRCEHFAPPSLMRLKRPLCKPSGPAPPPPLPLVSCVMPTRNRAEFALHAVRLFGMQDYPSRELIIVDDGGDELARRLPDDPRISYLRCAQGTSIGEKRNVACERAGGEFIAEWDDDDWYGRERLSAQMAPLIDGRADLTGIADVTILELDLWRFWQLTPQLRERMFLGGVPSGTLVFRRSLWGAGNRRDARFPAISVAEDAVFLRRALAAGARLQAVDTGGMFVYVRHGQNTWRFTCGREFDPRSWRRVEEPTAWTRDRAFYAGRSHAASKPPARPLVSCLMPTCNRRPFLARAIAYFQRQDYPNRELIVLDDGDDAIADLIPDDPWIRYVRLDQKQPVGTKRNRACELAAGEILLNWDDDDWHAPNRISYQVAELERHGAEVCGADRILYFDPGAARAWLYEYPAARRAWVAGGTLCYRKALWRRNPFAPLAVGEDTRFVWSPAIGTPHALGEHRFYAALIHPTNTSRKDTCAAFWSERPIAEVMQLLGDDYRFYEEAARR